MRHSLYAAIVAPALFALACGSAAPAIAPPLGQAGADSAVTPTTDAAPTADAATNSRQVAGGVWELDSQELEAPNADLAPLAPLLDGAKVVGIGENWHTTGGQHAMRGRAIRYMVETLGYRTVMLETPWLTATPLTEYVAKGGDISAAMQSMFKVFAGTHMQALVEWLRAWNVAHPDDTVEFFGFDVQEAALIAGSLRGYVHDKVPAREHELLAFLPNCYCGTYPSAQACGSSPDAQFGYRKKEFPAARDEACHLGQQALEAALQRDAAEFVAASSQRSWQLAVIAAHNLWAAHRTSASQDFLAGFLARDEGMKDAVIALSKVRVGGGGTVLMAHNAHVERSSDNTWLRGNRMPRQQGMGARLFGALGQKYRVIGQVSWETQINWDGAPQPAPNTKANSIERALNALEKPYLLVDLRGPSEVVNMAETYSYDAMAGFVTFVPQDTFDALLFMNTSEAMVTVK